MHWLPSLNPLRGLALIFLLLFSSASCVAQPEVVELKLPDLEGKMRDLSEFRGKWLVVNYWATWCPPCREELPELEVFHNSRDDAMVIGINKEDIRVEKLKRFMEEQFLSFPVLREPPGARSALGALRGLPTTFIIDPQGRARMKKTGPVTNAMLDNAIERLMKGEGQ